MSNEKFTPGEWGVSEFTYNNGDAYQCTVSAGLPEVCICVPTGRVNREQCKANAHLIAAAPEMYALLSLMVSPTIMMNDELRTTIEAVLKKARGEE